MWGHLQNTSFGSVVTDPVVIYGGIACALAMVGLVATVPIVYVGAVLVAVAVVEEPTAVAVGGAAGLIIFELLQGAVGYWTPIVPAWIVVFVGMVAWLAPISVSYDASESEQPSIPRFVGAVCIAGLYATALGAWLGIALSGERFYTAAAGLLPGVPAVAGLGTIALLASSRFGRRALAEPVGGDVSQRLPTILQSDGGTERPVSKPGVTTMFGLFVLGAAWLGGTVAIDVLAHDLGLFELEGQLLDYVAGIVGTDSSIASAGATVFVGIYRYGELAVLLSAPVTIAATWGVHTYGRRVNDE